MRKGEGTFDPTVDADGNSPARGAAPAEPAGPQAITASHEVLFQTSEPDACDACGGPLPERCEDDGYELPGSAVYMWARGDSVRFEKAPLCASCAAAIGVAALSRWEIEEEEG